MFQALECIQEAAMRVHNLMEDLVIQKVVEMFPGSSVPLQQDVACYVLNRVSPEYVVSGRGIAHSETMDYQKKVQRLADLTRLVKDGIQLVTQNRRERSPGNFGPSEHEYYFNFPSIIGRLFHGVNFAPMSDVSIGLYHKGSLVQVIDSNWQNPYKMVSNTPGTFLFWPHPIGAESEDEEKSFEMELRVQVAGFEDLHHFFDVKLKSSNEFVDFVNTTTSHRTPDLYLFPSEESFG